MKRKDYSIIYALTAANDPLDVESIRYIGKTAFDPEERLRKHIVSVNLGSRTHVHNWIRGAGEIKIHILAIVSHEHVSEYEQIYIAALRQKGAPLTNLSDGGCGPAGYSHTVEARARMSAAHKNIPLKELHAERVRKHLEKIRANPVIEMKRWRLLVEKLKTRTPEMRALIAEKSAAAQKGRSKSLETRLKIAESLRGLKQSEETKRKRRESLQKAYAQPHIRAKLKLRRTRRKQLKQNAIQGVLPFHQ